jgi:hypothetical protein
VNIAWDRWIGNLDGEPVYFQKRLFSWRWRGNVWTLRLHKFVKADNAACFHTHPAHAYRLILWGGYVEEILNPEWLRNLGNCRATWRPGMFGYVAPELCHRIDALRNGRTSYSLWIHGPKVASIELHGAGWPDHLMHHAGLDRVRVPSRPSENSL